MPIIREYTSQTSAEGEIGGRRATAEDFGNGAGLRMLGGSVAEVGNLVQETVERQEVSDVQARLARTRADWTVHLTERAAAAPTGDAGFAAKFNEDFRKSLDKLGEGVTTAAGNQAFRRGAGELSAHFVQAAGLQQAASMALKAKQDYTTILESNRNALFADPTQFESVLRQTSDAMNDPNGPYFRMGPQERAALERQTRAELALSAVQGVLRLAPEMAEQQLTAGRWDAYLDADDKAALLRGADVAKRARATEAQRLEAQAERERREYVQAVQDEFVAKMETGKLATRDILDSDLPAVGQGSKEHFLNVLEARARDDEERPIRKIPTMFLGIVEGIRTGAVRTEVQIEAIYADSVRHGAGISFTDMVSLRKELQELRTPEGQRLSQRRANFLSAITPQLDKSNPLMGRIDSTGKQQVYEFSVFLDRQIAEARAAGRNPHDLFDPTKPEYLGRPGILAQYQRTMQQSLKGMADSVRRRGSLDEAPPAAGRKRASLGDAAEAVIGGILDASRPDDYPWKRVFRNFKGELPTQIPTMAVHSALSVVQSLLPGDDAPPAADAPTAAKAPPQRLPNETPAQYLERTR